MKLKFTFIAILLFSAFSCEKMEDNYSKYKKKEKIYSPRITNLTAIEGLKTATLNWDNPQGSIAKKILIDFQDDSLMFETMVNTAVLNNLEIKAYTVTVYTLDEFGNRSVPTKIQIFPNGEE